MAGSSRRPEQLNWARTIEKDFASITVEELEALAKRYLREEPLRLTIIPESAVAD
jgi:zinc protease